MEKKIEEKAKEYSREIYPYPTIEMPDSDLQTALIIGYKKALQQTPSSLRTDEEIEREGEKQVREFYGEFEDFYDEFIFFTRGAKWFRTNFSSEKKEGEKFNKVDFLEDVIKVMKNSYGIKYFSEHKFIEGLKELLRNG